MRKKAEQDDLRPEYDLKSMQIVDRGHGRFLDRTMVTLEPDVAVAFPTSQAVNEALRELIQRASNK